MRLYFKYASVILRSVMQYKGSFLMTAFGQFITSFSALLGMYFLFSRFHSVAGFSFSEVLLCLAVMFMSSSLAECFARGFDTFSGIISNGEFDRIMVRPRHEILQVLGSKIEFTRIGRFLQAVLVLVYAVPKSGVVWSADKILTLVLMICGGVAVFSGLFLVYAALCFFTTEGLEFMNVFIYGGREFGQYPFSVYGKRVLRFLTYIVPLALVQYYPFLYLIGRAGNTYYMFLPLVGSLFLIPCLLFWRFGVRHYKSTGS